MAGLGGGLLSPFSPCFDRTPFESPEFVGAKHEGLEQVQRRAFLGGPSLNTSPANLPQTARPPSTTAPF